ncbi:MAG: NADH:flavin oxidoreductase [Gammaproteobacteria bacterium]|nr:NADH:flavin oxidoreductase [Gammaproteobacteria bacterium]
MTGKNDVLFTPFRIGNLQTRNRFVMAPMTRCFSPEGVPGEDVVRYYRRRAEAQVGLIVTEAVGVDHPASTGEGSVAERNLPLLHGEAALNGWRRVVDEVHAAGGLIFPQLWHMGPVRIEKTGPHPDAPSCRPSGLWGPAGQVHSIMPGYLERVEPLTRPMTESQIADVIAGYARSAANARAVGFDGIAIHGAHGYLIDSFFWDVTNRRQDRYGGELAARARFAAEAVKVIRDAAGPLPILFRFSQWKLQDYEATSFRNPAELELVLGMLADAGVDIFEASTRQFSKPAFAGSSLSLAGWAKKLSAKPTICVGGVGLGTDLINSIAGQTGGSDNLDLVRERLEAGEFDLVAVGRALLVDPEFALKVRDAQALKPFSMESVASLY